MVIGLFLLAAIISFGVIYSKRSKAISLYRKENPIEPIEIERDPFEQVEKPVNEQSEDSYNDF
jgi:hypothetical protein